MNKDYYKQQFQKNFDDLGFNINWKLLDLEIDIHIIKKSDNLFSQGKLANKIYYLHTGVVRYVSVTDQGKEFTQAFAQAPNIIGSTRAMVTQGPALFSIQALEDCIITSFDWQLFINRMSLDTEFLKCYVSFLENIFIKKEERENEFVKESAQTRYLNFCVQYPNLKDTLPKQQIASYLGITAVALSRIRTILKQ
ncbi:MAG: Crp/Fnr family transcriptional regulator [Saccharospirillaceae bacterium]|nr:Crp/Fnr family transcriptional regulator [Pseudomonadales bacterium]NRB77542.1 Crp/Fnr family transcriptional regulator [Saccharospirillaceae bacterium]